MATTFLKSWFSPSKNTNGKNKETGAGNIKTFGEDQESSAIPPARRLSLSKSGKMKRKSYAKQSSVKDATFFTPPSTDVDRIKNSENNNVNCGARTSEQDDIDAVIADLLDTAENTRV
ncbi:hypothetical protein Trydic_g18667 [Trypoxylus dichotomus]